MEWYIKVLKRDILQIRRPDKDKKETTKNHSILTEQKFIFSLSAITL